MISCERVGPVEVIVELSGNVLGTPMGMGHPRQKQEPFNLVKGVEA